MILQVTLHMEFLPEALSGTVLYEPGMNPREEEMRKKVKESGNQKIRLLNNQYYEKT